MSRKLVLFLLLSAVPAFLLAQIKMSDVRAARQSLRNDKKSDVEAVIKKLTPADSLENLYLSGMLEKYTFEKANENLYLGKKVDTLKVFSGLYNMFRDFWKVYPYIKENNGLRHPLVQAFTQHSGNLRNGGDYYLVHQKFQEAFNLYHTFLEIHREGLFDAQDSVLALTYKNAMIAADRTRRPELIVALGEEAAAQKIYSMDIDLQYCEALRKLERTDQWTKALEQSIERYPQEFVFYGMLIDYDLSHDKVADAMQIADELVMRDSSNCMNCFVKGYVCQHTDDMDCALEWLNRSNRLNADYVPALCSLGYCTIRVAEKKENAITDWPYTPAEKEMIQTCYREAEGYLEKARRLAPADKQDWANLLWKVYYKLNEGEKLDEIEKLLDK